MKANYSNEGGIGRTFRYQKNIVGMWAVNQAVADLGLESASMLEKLAAKSAFSETADLNAPEFMTPGDFSAKLKAALLKEGKSLPSSIPDICSSVLHSLALLYKNALDELEANTGDVYDELYIVGGGANNRLLNSLTEKYTGKRVIALPIEATAIGNLKIQRG